jgi:hypothetical protein
MASHSPEYRRYVKSPKWVARKRQYFDRFPRRCAACGTYPSKAKLIHLHHASYENLGNEPDSDLFPLCVARGWRRRLGFKGCHDNVYALAATGHYKDLGSATEALVDGERRKRQRRERRASSGRA